LAWFHATPEGEYESRLEVYRGEDPDYKIHLPPIEGAEYLIEFFHELGLVMQTAEGIAPLNWQEMESWYNLTNKSLSNWELKLLKMMSHSYACEFNRAKSKDAKMPYALPDEIDRTSVLVQAKSVFKSIRKNQEK
jgi:hypothetical protein